MIPLVLSTNTVQMGKNNAWDTAVPKELRGSRKEKTEVKVREKKGVGEVRDERG